MPGIKGMKHSKPRIDTARRNIWRSIRILRTFTLSDITRTLPEGKYCNVRKFVAALVKHGYIAKTGRYTGGILGAYQSYRIVKDSVEYPTICARCKKSLTAAKCTPKETDKEVMQNEENQPDIGILEASHDAN